MRMRRDEMVAAAGKSSGIWRHLCRLATVLPLCGLFCAAPIRQFYPDSYFPEHNIYENKTIGFALTFRGAWNIISDPAGMNRQYRTFCRSVQRSGGELLFVGSSVEGLYGVKAIAFNLNEPPQEYARYIRDINSMDVQNEIGPVDFFTADHAMAKWVYDKSGYRFVEFFFIVDTYNVRLSFWTRPQLSENFLPVFEEIAATLTLTAGF